MQINLNDYPSDSPESTIFPVGMNIGRAMTLVAEIRMDEDEDGDEEINVNITTGGFPEEEGLTDQVDILIKRLQTFIEILETGKEHGVKKAGNDAP